MKKTNSTKSLSKVEQEELIRLQRLNFYNRQSNNINENNENNTKDENLNENKSLIVNNNNNNNIKNENKSLFDNNNNKNINKNNKNNVTNNNKNPKNNLKNNNNKNKNNNNEDINTIIVQEKYPEIGKILQDNQKSLEVANKLTKEMEKIGKLFEEKKVNPKAKSYKENNTLKKLQEERKQLDKELKETRESIERIKRGDYTNNKKYNTKTFNNNSYNYNYNNRYNNNNKNKYSTNSYQPQKKTGIYTFSDINNNNNNNNINQFSEITNFKVDLYSKKYPKEVVQILTNQKGLLNIGNTCYMNTCLQLLIHCPPFIYRFYKYFQMNNVLSSKISYEFFTLINKLIKSKYGISPKEFKDNFGKLHKEYNNRRQHDTQEFCRIFLDDLSKELNLIKKIPEYKEIDDKGKSKMQLYEEYDFLFKSRENSIITDTFYGKIINIFICQCGKESYSFEKFLDIPLIFFENDKLNNLLYNYFDNNVDIEWNEICPNCQKNKQMHKKFTKISYLPNILMISLQNIDKKNITFDKYLDLSRYSDNECCLNQSKKYKLIGVSNHDGDENFGHYYAYININNMWFEFNDGDVRVMNDISYDSRSAYVLYYERQ